MIDPDNPVVRLCAEGVTKGGSDAAHKLYRRAWETAIDPFEACVAAHYLGRQARAAEVALAWNQTALERAVLDTTGRVHGFHASLHLNLARSYEDLGNAAEALRHYALAEERIVDVDVGPYRDLVARGAAAGLRRISAL